MVGMLTDSGGYRLVCIRGLCSNVSAAGLRFVRSSQFGLSVVGKGSPSQWLVQREPGCGIAAVRMLAFARRRSFSYSGSSPVPMFKVYVGNLDPRTTVETLKPYFDPFGEAVDEIILALDAEGQPRGFAIVLFRDPQLGQLAIETLTGKRINGREVQINEAVKKGKRTQPVEKAPRTSPLGPRAFQRPGQGGVRPGLSRPGSSRPSGFGSRPGADRPGFGGASAGGASRFSRNPRRAPGAPGAGPLGPGASDAGAPGSAPSSPSAPLSPGSRMIGGGAGASRPLSRPLGGGTPVRPASPRPPMAGDGAAGGATSRPLGTPSSRPLGAGGASSPRPAGAPPARPTATPAARPPVPPAGATPPVSDAPAADAPPPRPRAVKKKPPTDA